MADGVRVVREGERSVGAATAGMIREEAVSTEGSWAGLVRTEPRMTSGWHHHGEYETAFYVVSGSVRLEFGAQGRESAEAGPGDFVRVPRGAIHRESNPLDEEGAFIVFRAGSGESVVNVDGPAPAA